MSYNGKSTDTLDTLRYHRFCEKVASSSTYIQPQVLPPTSVAAKYHSLRVYLQVQEWKGSKDGPNPTWQKCDGGFVPTQTTLPPEKLLRVQLPSRVRRRQSQGAGEVARVQGHWALVFFETIFGYIRTIFGP